VKHIHRSLLDADFPHFVAVARESARLEEEDGQVERWIRAHDEASMAFKGHIQTLPVAGKKRASFTYLSKCIHAFFVHPCCV
jgi:hypothetical protein